MLKINNIKLGFATNSSSYHSLILNGASLKPWDELKDQWETADIDGTKKLLIKYDTFGWDYFGSQKPITDSSIKAAYIYTQILTRSNLEEGADKDYTNAELEMLRTIIEDYTGQKAVFEHETNENGLPEDHFDTWYIDHQSEWTDYVLHNDKYMLVPTSIWDFKLANEEEMKLFIFSDAKLIISNDNEDNSDWITELESENVSSPER